MQDNVLTGVWAIVLGIATFLLAPAIARSQIEHNLSNLEEPTVVRMGRFIAALMILFGVAAIVGLLP